MLVTRLNRAQILLAQGEFPKECDELEAVYRDLFEDTKNEMSNGVQNDQWETVQGGSPKELMDEVADGFGKALLHKGSKMRKLGNLTEAESILREAVEVFCLSSAGSLPSQGSEQTLTEWKRCLFCWTS